MRIQPLGKGKVSNGRIWTNAATGLGDSLPYSGNYPPGVSDIPSGPEDPGIDTDEIDFTNNRYFQEYLMEQILDQLPQTVTPQHAQQILPYYDEIGNVRNAGDYLIIPVTLSSAAPQTGIPWPRKVVVKLLADLVRQDQF